MELVDTAVNAFVIGAVGFLLYLSNRGLRREFAVFRAEMRQELAELRAENRQELAELRREYRGASVRPGSCGPGGWERAGVAAV